MNAICILCACFGRLICVLKKVQATPPKGKLYITKNIIQYEKSKKKKKKKQQPNDSYSRDIYCRRLCDDSKKQIERVRFI